MIRCIEAPATDDALGALAALAGKNEQRGVRTVVFCEDRLTLLAERAVVKGTGGSFLAEVTTFARFLQGAGKTVSKQGSVMALSALIEEHGSELKCFGKGAAQAVYETIAQLNASCVDAAALRASAEGTEGMLRLKLADLALLSEAYGAFLQERGLLDESGYLALLPSRISALKDAEVVFFAFPSFTRQALEGVRAAMESARAVTGIFLCGDEPYYTREAAAGFLRTAELFGGAEVHRLPPSYTGDAAVLARALYRPEGTGEPPRPSSAISFTAADEAKECDAVAALIKKYIAEGKRYRDIVVLAGSTEYFPAIGKAFDAYEIPYCADRKRPYSEHPFCSFVLSVVEAAGDGVLPEEADDIAASAYFGEGSEYRNYLLRYGAYRGAVRREIREELMGFCRDDLVAARERMLALLAPFRARATVKNYADGVRKLREIAQEKQTTRTLAEGLSGEERAFLEIDRLEQLLAEAEEIAGERTVTAREFAALLRSGMEALSVSLFPRRSDAVFVGDIAESKACRAPVLFCIGLTEEVPAVSQDTAVISDGEIARLNKLGAEIGPAIAQVNGRARETVALNLCAFSEILCMSRPLRFREEETAASELFLYAAQALRFSPLPDLFPYNCSARGPALLNFFSMCDGVQDAQDAAKQIARYSSVREALLHPAAGEPIDPDALRAGADKGTVAEAGELYFRGDVSPTLLETYFSCPYKSFAMRALRLAERNEGSMNVADAGTFVHAVLEGVARRFNELDGEDACRAAARGEAERLLASPRYAALCDTGAGDYAGGRLVEDAVTVTAEAYKQLAGSAFRVRDTEAEVRLPELGLKGKTDRVDEADGFVRVIDYKTGKTDKSAVSYYTGQKLQLELYLRAVSEGKQAAGAFYFPASDDFTREDKAEGKFRMLGFYCRDDAVMRRMDTAAAGGKSAYYESGNVDGAMDGEEFGHFLDYSVLVSEKAVGEMRAGNVRPSPYAGACTYCKLKGACGFSGTEREEPSVKCGEIARIAASGMSAKTEKAVRKEQETGGIK